MGLFDFFRNSKKNDPDTNNGRVSIESILSALKLGTDQDLLEILGVNFYSLKKASDQILKNNPSDLKAGV
ncbi:MAG: hypothetical protein KDE33_29670, partial [Bacteroidetes bacterium]|nr:hypothetical protein [Bacteroidota bacterium]